ncbi:MULTISPECIES: transcription-repair coupling factor [Candidatus Ichthyocystis]|uniref:Transcription-repair-coupling factor n=1 Tax=Candidatus Ichthyocystis hellenicum TaxID=1561003 RepID=A0A0S4M676_9BURK|nr:MULTISPECIES: transcription-repair coupling factor [Ichthyocystis]CUT17640.1 putative transcription-repair-coupling factor [Candidatus Ichthyocystis hellenicum]
MKSQSNLLDKHCLPGVDSYQISKLDKKLLIVTEKVEDSRRLLHEIKFYFPSKTVHILPDWETLPYERFSPHQDLVSERLEALWLLHQNQVDIIITPVTTAIQRLIPIEYMASRTFIFKAGENNSYERIKKQITESGYNAVSQVYRCGEFSIRGSIVDLFPMGSEIPYRLDFFDDKLDSIRSFDVDTQKSIESVTNIRILPAREIPTDEKGIQCFRKKFRSILPGEHYNLTLYKDVSNGIFPAGVEYYLPLFHDKLNLLTDYLSEDTTIIRHGDLNAGIEKFWETLHDRYRTLNYDPSFPLLSPEHIYITSEEFFISAQSRNNIRISVSEDDNSNSLFKTAPLVAINSKNPEPLLHLKKTCKDFSEKIIIVCESVGRRGVLLDLLSQNSMPLPVVVSSFCEAVTSNHKFVILVGNLSRGWLLPNQFMVITELELFPSMGKRWNKRRKTSEWEFWIKDLSELKIGQPVVHRQHGVGRYHGLETMVFDDNPAEFVRLHYADDDKLFVPISELNLLSRYTGSDSDKAPLNKLGNSSQWEKTCAKAREKAHDTAVELLEIYSRRKEKKGSSLTCSQEDYEKFCEEFDFEETHDQLDATKSVIEDLKKDEPMDRVICGDVGFGKTEVALRAAFIATMSGKQVALLCPTTLLANQHYRVFSSRFSQWPIKIAELSRFRSNTEVTKDISKISDGSIDIVIGTHRLLQKDVSFCRLGLVIIDEEHRFGVRQKEVIKEWRADTDMLSMTATPIPRTLSLCLDGIRSFSIISTPPQRRLAIKTIISPDSKAMIKEAILRELKRSGQVYFLYNEVSTINNKRLWLQELVPEARIAVAHGQMPSGELEHIMRDFSMHRYNILLCTTIIENGIDNPNANTIIIHRADKFGLAQLHQIRGRVGRSHHQAYAYLIIPNEESLLTPDAQKRLNAIRSADDLGAGFFLARHDLEIRGAGELLGEAQSGEMHQVGFDLFTEMLQDTVKKLSASKSDGDTNCNQRVNSKIHCYKPILLPHSYCPDVGIRLGLYKRLSDCQKKDDIDEIRMEIIDRFGPLPEATERLILMHKLRIDGNSIGICEINIKPQKAVIQISDPPLVDGWSILNSIKTVPSMKILKNNSLSFEWSGTIADAAKTITTFIATVHKNNSELSHTNK